MKPQIWKEPKKLAELEVRNFCGDFNARYCKMRLLEQFWNTVYKSFVSLEFDCQFFVGVQVAWCGKPIKTSCWARSESSHNSIKACVRSSLSGTKMGSSSNLQSSKLCENFFKKECRSSSWDEELGEFVHQDLQNWFYIQVEKPSINMAW